MRLVGLALVASIAAGCAGCAGSRPVPDEEVPVQDEAQLAEESPGAPTGPAVALPDDEYATAPDAPAEGAAPAEEQPPTGLALPPVGNATWIAPEIRTLAQALNDAEKPPTAVYYAGGTHAGGCLELYRFRFLYGAKERWADVAGFESLDHAEKCQQIVQRQGAAVPERIGVFLVDFAPELGTEPAVRTQFTDAVGNLSVGTATAIPRHAEPYGAEPGTVVRRRQPPPAG